MLGLHKLKTARYAVPWDWYKDSTQTTLLNWWMSRVKAAHLQPLISFNRNWHASGRKKIPSLSQYKHGFKLFRQQFPYVKDFSAWNEPNAPEQPFYKKPAKAATFFNALRSACKKCRIVAADINDSKNMVPWMRTYKRHVRKAKYWGLHNYKDTSSRNTRGTTKRVRRHGPRPGVAHRDRRADQPRRAQGPGQERQARLHAHAPVQEDQARLLLPVARRPQEPLGLGLPVADRQEAAVLLHAQAEPSLASSCAAALAPLRSAPSISAANGPAVYSPANTSRPYAAASAGSLPPGVWTE